MFERLYEQYAEKMWRYAVKITGDPVLSRDILHDAFVKLIEHEHTLRKLHEKQLDSYILITVKHLCFQTMKQDGIIVSIPYTSVPETRTPESITFQKFDDESLKRIVQSLPHAYRDVIVLRYYCQLSYKEIARLLHIRPANARMIASRARIKLYDMMREETV